MRLALILCVVALLGAGQHGAPAPNAVSFAASRLQGWEVGSQRRAVILLHGYGSAAREWLPIVARLHGSTARRFVLPEGPGTGPQGRGRGWWPLDLASHLDGTGLPDLSRVRPGELAAVAQRVRALVDDAAATAGPGESVVLGGFSQGAMVSAEVAFRSDEPLSALILLSPTVIDEAAWLAGLPARRGLPVFVSHGRADRVLPFAASERLARHMRAAGLRVIWVPFDGGHDIPASVVDALQQFLASVDRP